VASADFVLSIMDNLPTAEVWEIVRRVRPRLYIDFFQYLPTEVCLKILGFLDPTSLMNTAKASRQWMVLALDRKLWEHLYHLEGFRVNRAEIERFEMELSQNQSTVSDHLQRRADRARPGNHLEDSQPSKKRATPQRMQQSSQGDEDSEMVDSDAPADMQEQSLFGPSRSGRSPREIRLSTDEIMSGHPTWSPISPSSPYRARPTSSRNNRPRQPRQSGIWPSPSPSSPNKTSTLSHLSSLSVLDENENRRKLNWQYLYSQRRRLEAHWESEKYINFQLPHPDYPEEAHKECIYTIQFCGKYLVSGSRDQTLRIWDLDTRRLVRPPLTGHSGSVLCLQFDADEDEDLIVSGSSDATVIIWQFSTGHMIQRLSRAHRESVLNVRFDKRVLVTCSKDKTIKVFNRHPLKPGDRGYPTFAPVPIRLNNFGFNPAPSAGLPVKRPFSLIGCLEGHGAAVNAVQIFGDEVVSASGDRTVKVWNWPEQTCTRTLLGHQKGIACVQYDGRRIVSGSSDNEVKVFDKESGLEVASLRAHSNLVRTVQAGFGDLPYSVEEDLADAKRIDHEYFKAVDEGSITAADIIQRGRPRNAGSRRPEDITAYGAKLPPGGGGGKFGRIVSGSYDETIIIWRRDKEGVWRAQHTLRQEEAAALAAISDESTRRNRLPTIVPALAATNASAGPSASHPPLPTLTAQSNAGPSTASAIEPPASSDAHYRFLIDNAFSEGPAALQHLLCSRIEALQHPHLRNKIDSLSEGSREVIDYVVTTAFEHHGLDVPMPTYAHAPPATPALLQQFHQAVNNSQSLSHAPSSQGSLSAPQNVSSTPATTALPPPNPPQINITSQGPVQPPTAQNPAPPAPHHHTHPGVPHVHAIHHANIPSMARVFKLQFDARRIICCSQMTNIVGWDFANNDAQIIAASKFFAPIE
jgi:F-box and WD-40 domain protein 1/11